MLYLSLALPLSIWQRDLISTDGIAFLRHAFYLTEGRLLDSVSSYWSPLLIWSLAPLQAWGLDGLYASRTVLVTWGLVLLLASHLFANRCTELGAAWKAVSLALVALATVTWTTSRLNSDVAMAACLIAYCAFAAGPDLLARRRSQIFAGLLAGVAFLAKAYALPFFLAHFSFSVAARAWATPGSRRSTPLRAWLVGLASFTLVAGPWIGVLSWKYDALTISSAAAINHAIVGPETISGIHAWNVHPIATLQEPSPGRLVVWEQPEALPYAYWSPFESATHLHHQVEVIVANALSVASDLQKFDTFGFSVIGLLGLQIFLLVRGDPRERFRPIWILGTLTLFLGGFLPLWYEARYLTSFLWPLCCLGTLDVLRKVLGTAFPERGTRPSSSSWAAASGWALTLLSIFSLALPQCAPVARGLVSFWTEGPAHYYRDSAASMRLAGFEGPFATTSEFQDEVMFFAYHLEERSVGVVSDSTVSEVEDELAAHRVATFFVDSRWPLLADFLRSSDWIRRGTIEAGPQQVILFRPASKSLRERDQRGAG